MDENNLQELSVVAAMYYLEGVSQEEIAQKFFVSRSTISRMLKKAREKGVVTVKVNFLSRRNTYYEQKLKERFGIETIVVNLEDVSEANAEESICRELAAWMNERLRDNDIIGVTRGSLIHQMIDYIVEPRGKNLSFVQLMGTEAIGSSQRLARDIVSQLAELYQGRPYYIDAPLVFQSTAGRDELLKVPTISRTLQLAKRADLILTTVPRIQAGSNEHVWRGFVDVDVVDDVAQKGGVGWLFGRAFNIEGEFLDIPLNSYIISTDLEALKSRNITAACYGKEFSKAALGALRSGFVKAFITDAACAEGILELAEGKIHHPEYLSGR